MIPLPYYFDDDDKSDKQLEARDRRYACLKVQKFEVTFVQTLFQNHFWATRILERGIFVIFKAIFSQKGVGSLSSSDNLP